jgi:type II secretory pathway pseudopilin PulG
MRTGETPASPRPARGFTYLWLLFAVALGGAATAVAATQWRTASQREKERELLFRGEEIARAISSFRAATAQGTPPWPASFEQLIEDRRGGIVRRHLRRLYTDPFTGRADWVAQGREGVELRGVSSRASVPALMTTAFADTTKESGVVLVSDKIFGAAIAAQTASAPTRADAHPPLGP